MNGYSVLGNSRIRSQYQTLPQRYRAQERDESKFIENVEREPFEINWIPGPERKKANAQDKARSTDGCTPYGELYCTGQYCTVLYSTVHILGMSSSDMIGILGITYSITVPYGVLYSVRMASVHPVRGLPPRFTHHLIWIKAGNLDMHRPGMVGDRNRDDEAGCNFNIRSGHAQIGMPPTWGNPHAKCGGGCQGR